MIPAYYIEVMLQQVNNSTYLPHHIKFYKNNTDENAIGKNLNPLKGYSKGMKRNHSKNAEYKLVSL